MESYFPSRYGMMSVMDAKRRLEEDNARAPAEVLALRHEGRILRHCWDVLKVNAVYLSGSVHCLSSCSELK